MRFVILAQDPDEKLWSVVHQSDEADGALDFWKEVPDDPSDRIMLDTEQFVYFKPGDSNAT